MNENTAVTLTPAKATTRVAGYYNPNQYRVLIQISELNATWELAPGAFLHDSAGRNFNDPIFDAYVQPKGLARSMCDRDIPIYYAPRPSATPAARPANAVSQATGFVRQADGTVVPIYNQVPTAALPDAAINRPAHIGMSVAKAREMGLIGKPRLLPEDYGATDSTGGPPSSKDIPSIKYSLESPPKIQTAAPMTPVQAEMDEKLSPEEAARRAGVQRSLASAANRPSGDQFDPGALRPATAVPLRAPKEPTAFVGQKPVPLARRPVQASPAQQARRQVAEVVEEAPAPASPPPPPEEPAEPVALSPAERAIQLAEEFPDPVLESPPPPAEEEPQFICLADGKRFRTRDELERYVRRKYPQVYNELLKNYPAEQ